MRDNAYSCYRVPVAAQDEHGLVGWGQQESLSDSFRAVSRRLRIQTQTALAPWEVTPAQAHRPEVRDDVGHCHDRVAYSRAHSARGTTT